MFDNFFVHCEPVVIVASWSWVLLKNKDPLFIDQVEIIPGKRNIFPLEKVQTKFHIYMYGGQDDRKVFVPYERLPESYLWTDESHDDVSSDENREVKTYLSHHGAIWHQAEADCAAVQAKLNAEQSVIRYSKR